MILAPRLAAFFRKVAATGWFCPGRAPMMIMQSLSLAAMKGAVTAPEPMPSLSAATEEAWHSRVQWSTLLVWTAVRIRSEEHTSELQSLMRISYAVFYLKKTKT